MISLYDLSLAELTDFLAGLGERPFRAKQLYLWMYRKGENNIDRMTDVPLAAREKLKACARTDDLFLAESLESKDGQTAKQLFGTLDGNFIETVFMKYKERNAICISTQAGCRMGCKFCASGKLGLARNLTPAEMALQVILSERATGAYTKNIVLMGIGEPLDNYDNVKKFLDNLTDDHGRDLSRRSVTLSTCGLVPEIDRLAEDLPQVNLAVSLHASNDELRSQIMPINNKWNVAETMAAVRRHYEKTGRRPTIEYALIEGFNDGPEHVKELAGLLKGLNCLVNLIPLNETPAEGKGQGAASTVKKRANAAEAFREALGAKHVPATVRYSLGADIDAACGQLRLRHTVHD